MAFEVWGKAVDGIVVLKKWIIFHYDGKCFSLFCINMLVWTWDCCDLHQHCHVCNMRDGTSLLFKWFLNSSHEFSRCEVQRNYPCNVKTGQLEWWSCVQDMHLTTKRIFPLICWPPHSTWKCLATKLLEDPINSFANIGDFSFMFVGITDTQFSAFVVIYSAYFMKPMVW